MNHFARLHALGYQRLVPVIPPTATISPNSTLFKRVGTPQDGRGKTPGRINQSGTWGSYDWTAYENDEVDLARWHDMGAGTGIKTGVVSIDGPFSRSLIAIDADTLNLEHAKTIRDQVESYFGRLPVRVGQHPKAVYLLRTRGPAMKYMRVEFGDERVEILSDGKQFVAEGIHPKTGQPYSWPREIVPFDDLLEVETGQVISFMNTLHNMLPAASSVIIEGGGSEVAQGSLSAPLAAVRKAVLATPNTSNHFPTRESYRNYGYAIKAALPDDPDAALELFHEWCDRWTGPHGETNDPDVVDADWRRMKPPFRRGASWLFDLAEERGEFNRVSDLWFDASPPVYVAPEPSLFDLSVREPIGADLYPLLSAGEIVNRPPPVFLIDRHIPEVSLGFLYADPGVGKSFVALDMALHIAYGRAAWHGDPINVEPETVVLYIAAEGSFGFRNRIKAWMQARGAEDFPKRFFMIEKTINFMRPEDVDKLLRTAKSIAGLRPCLIIVDTVSRALPGSDENLQKEMSLFVGACGELQAAFRCAVLGVHHANREGTMRGSTVLLGAGDFVFKLERKKGATIGNLICQKQKDAPDGWEEPYRFEVQHIGEGQSSLVVNRSDLEVGPDLELTPATSAMVLRAMRDAWEAREPWSKVVQTGERYALRRMVADFGFKAAAAEELLQVWEQTGVIQVATASAKGRKVGFQVVGRIAEPERIEGIFG
jgi:hypothetical protein